MFQLLMYIIAITVDILVLNIVDSMAGWKGNTYSANGICSGLIK
jgi:hypothetical protein